MLELKKVNLSFEEKQIFNNFNLTINKGDKLLLSAPSGSGKSTLFKILLGFQQIDGGDILYNGNKVNERNIRKLRSKMAYVSQDVELRSGKVIDFIQAIYAFKFNYTNTFDKNKLNRFMEHFQLSEKILEKKTEELSGGERQRIGLIIAILLEREIYLLDEVTSGLESDLKDKVVSYMSNLDKTVLIISHDHVWKNTTTFNTVSW